MTIDNVMGVDFSGAKLAGQNTWIARCSVDGDHLVLQSLDRLETLAGTAERSPALAYLVDLVRCSRDALWGFDFPFGLPIELFPARSEWIEQFAFLESFGEDAPACGRECVRIARSLVDTMPIRRTTDQVVKTPFGCYHYRIIYQMYFGMRLVLDPLRQSNDVAILPFQTLKKSTTRIVVETCPSSTLKRLRRPFRKYKQSTGGPLTLPVRRNRHQILDGLQPWISIPEPLIRRAMRNSGGDALDAILAAVGTWQGFRSADHEAIARHERYPREGYIYA